MRKMMEGESTQNKIVLTSLHWVSTIAYQACRYLWTLNAGAPIICISSTVRLFHNNLYYKSASALLLLNRGCAFIVKPQNVLDTFKHIWRSIGCRLLGRLVNILWPFHGQISRSGAIAVVGTWNMNVSHRSLVVQVYENLSFTIIHRTWLFK